MDSASGGTQNRARILVAEDDSYLRQLLKLSLAKRYEVTMVQNGIDALTATIADKPDLVLLDVMMPLMNGFETLQKLREVSDVPVAMLTSQSADEDIMKGFSLGADDYIAKPFSFSELFARIEAILRRCRRPKTAETASKPTTDRILWLDEATRQVMVHGKNVEVTPLEFQLLRCLIASPQQSIGKDVLFRYAWGYDLLNGVLLVDQAVERLRHKIEDDPNHPVLIVSSPEGGYMYNGARSLQAA